MPSQEELQQMYAGADGAEAGAAAAPAAQQAQDLTIPAEQVAQLQQLAAAGKYEDLGKAVASLLQ